MDDQNIPETGSQPASPDEEVVVNPPVPPKGGTREQSVGGPLQADEDPENDNQTEVPPKAGREKPVGSSQEF